MKLLSFGEILWDVVGDTRHLGGAPLNLAVHAGRCGVEAGVISRVGRDTLGTEARAALAGDSVDTRYLQEGPEPTGRVDVTVSPDGQPRYHINENVAFDHIDLNAAQIEEVVREGVDLFCYGTLAQRGAVSRATLQRLLPRLQETQTTLFCDINLRQAHYDRAILASSVQACAILKLNDEEVPVLAASLGLPFAGAMDAFCQALARQWDVSVILVTLGAAGAGVYAQGRYQTVSGTAVEVADTIGAGDAFSAAFLAATLRGRPPVAAVELANRVGAYVASRAGALPAYDDEMKTLVTHA